MPELLPGGDLRVVEQQPPEADVGAVADLGWIVVAQRECVQLPIALGRPPAIDALALAGDYTVLTEAVRPVRRGPGRRPPARCPADRFARSRT